MTTTQTQKLTCGHDADSADRLQFCEACGMEQPLAVAAPAVDTTTPAYRAAHRPVISYQTGNGPEARCDVRHGATHIGYVYKDGLYGWLAISELAAITAGEITVVADRYRATKHEAVGALVAAYTAAWKAGRV